MSETSTVGRLGLKRMRPRDSREQHRASSSLELFFDLTFVVAVGIAAQQLATLEEGGDLGSAVLGYARVFFAIWWGWVNFTWFASGFDTDDWLYRLLTIAQMAGVLVLAAGIGPVFSSGGLGLIVAGYVLMRIALVAQWLRAARSPEVRPAALRYAVGVSIVQLLWVGQLLLPAALVLPTFFVLVAAELAVPAVAERAGGTAFHLRHIAERYGLFTLIVLGEGLLSTANAVIAALADAEHVGALALLGAESLLVVAAMWWIYFSREPVERLGTLRRSFAFGYLHYVVFAAAAAMAAGFEAEIAGAAETGEAEHPISHALVTVPIALFLLAVWWVVLRGSISRPLDLGLPLLAVVVAAVGLTGAGVGLAVLLLAVAVTALEVDARLDPSRRRRSLPAVGRK